MGGRIKLHLFCPISVNFCKIFSDPVVMFHINLSKFILQLPWYSYLQTHKFPKQVFKGKKMPGRMGAKQRTVKNVWVYKIDPARNLMWVKGQVCFS